MGMISELEALRKKEFDDAVNKFKWDVIGALRSRVKSELRAGKKNASILVVHNSYDRDWYGIDANEYEKLQIIVGDRTRIKVPANSIERTNIGSFDMEAKDSIMTLEESVEVITNALKQEEFRTCNVEIVTVPVYGYAKPFFFDAPNDLRIQLDGFERTIRIDVAW